MPEKAEAKAMLRLVNKLDQSIGDIQATDPPVSITMSDGSPNYAAIMRLLGDPEFESYRQANPQLMRSLQGNVNYRIATSGMQSFSDLTKLGFSMAQLKRAYGTQERIPSKLAAPRQDDQLAQEISRTQQDIERGMSQAERSLSRQEDDSVYRSEVSAAGQYSGGQASSASAYAAAAARRRETGALRRAAISEAQRNAAKQRMAPLLQMRQQQIDRGLQVDQYNSLLDREQFRVVNKAKQDLMRAGYTNAFNASDALMSDVDNLLGVFQDKTPGFVYAGNITQPDDGPLGPIYNSPLRTMQTGASLFNPQMAGLIGNMTGMADEVVPQQLGYMAASPFTGTIQ